MGSDVITRAMLTVGVDVEINPRGDRSRKKLIQGVVTEILTSSETHPHGIMVKLSSGEVGRVKSILSGGSVFVEPAAKVSGESFDDLIRQDESPMLEFKGSLLWSQDCSNDEIKKGSPELKHYGRDASKVILAKVIAAFLNTDGGSLILGIEEDKEGGTNQFVGIDHEYSKLKDKCEDGYRRMLVDGVFQTYLPEFIFNHFNDYLSISFHQKSDKNLCHIYIKKSDKRVFLKIKNESLFMIRVDATCRQLDGEAMVAYCEKRFR